MGQKHGANGENRISFSFAFQRLRPSTADGIALGPACQPFFSGLGQKLMAQGRSWPERVGGLFMDCQMWAGRGKSKTNSNCSPRKYETKWNWIQGWSPDRKCSCPGLALQIRWGNGKENLLIKRRLIKSRMSLTDRNKMQALLPNYTTKLLFLLNQTTFNEMLGLSRAKMPTRPEENPKSCNSIGSKLCPNLCISKQADKSA